MRTDFFDNSGARCSQRRAGKTALFAAVAVAGNRAFIEGGVGGDDAVHVGLGNGVEGGVECDVVEIGRDFDDYRHAARRFISKALLFGLDAREQVAQRRAVLQVAQPGGVGRRNIDGEIVGVRPGFLQADAVIIQRCFVRRVLVFAEVDAKQRAGFGGGGKAGGQGVDAEVVEAHAVDDGVKFGQAEQARARVARLRARGDGADFDEAKAGAVEGADGDAVFVQSGGKTEAVGEGQSHQFDGRAAAAARHEDGHAGEQGEDFFVRAFGV